ncbi:MAG: hypothetical protein AAF570_25395, partial [Bacteroidota bacterium]
MLFGVFISWRVHAQENLLQRGSFEPNIPGLDYPDQCHTFDVVAPLPWKHFKPNNGYESWYVDSVWSAPNPNAIDPFFSNAYFSVGG